MSNQAVEQNMVVGLHDKVAACLRDGDKAMALQLCERALLDSARGAEFVDTVELLFHVAGDENTAAVEPFIQRCVAREPEEPKFHFLLAISNLARWEFDTALVERRRAERCGTPEDELQVYDLAFEVERAYFDNTATLPTGGGRLPTSAGQIAELRAAVANIRARLNDLKLAEHDLAPGARLDGIAKMLDDVHQRVFHGNIMIGIVGILFGVLFCIVGLYLPGIVWLAGGGAYFHAARPMLYQSVALALKQKGQRQTPATVLLTGLFIPLEVAWNYFKFRAPASQTPGSNR